MQSSNKDFKVAIVGGGLCGLACAIGLARAGVHAEVFEAAMEFGEVGAGVGLGPNALDALERLGVLEAILARAEEPIPTRRSFRFISGIGSHQHIYDYPTTPNDLGLGIYRNVPVWSPYYFPQSADYHDRPDFLEALIPMIDPSLVHFNKRCVAVSTSASGSHVLHFAGGGSHETDLVIGADGIKSVVRTFVSKDSNDVTYSKTIAYRAVVPTEALEKAGVKTDMKSRPINWLGPDKHIITFPIQAKKLINIVFFSTNIKVPIGPADPTSWVQASSKEELFDEYCDWGNDVAIMLQQMNNPSKWYIHFLRPLSSFFRQKVVLVGDAAHAMLPHLGAGAGQGLEDAFALCALLGDARTKGHNLEMALKAYDTIRVPRANMVHKMSADAGDIYEGRGMAGNTVSDTRNQLAGIWGPVWHHDLAGEVGRTINNLYGRKACL